MRRRMARTSCPATAGIVMLTALAAAACGGSPTSPTPGPLTLTCPADVQTVAGNGQSASVTFPNPTVQGAAGGVTVSCSAPSGSAFPVGKTTVACTATDSRQASGQCTFSVTVTQPAPRLLFTRFLAFGDSLTEGTVSNPYVPLLLGPAESYPTRLQLLLADRYWAQSVTVINAGLGGERATDGVTRLPNVLAQQTPEVLLLLEGANDLNALKQAGITQAANALEEMVKEAQRRGIRVMLATLPPWRDGGPKQLDASLVPPLNDQIRMIAVAKGAVLVDLFAALQPDMNTLIGSDGLHPTEAGYQRMAATFFDVIVRTFEVPAGR